MTAQRPSASTDFEAMVEAASAEFGVWQALVPGILTAAGVPDLLAENARLRKALIASDPVIQSQIAESEASIERGDVGEPMTAAELRRRHQGGPGMTDLDELRARERLAAVVLGGVTIPAAIGAQIRDAILATHDAVAVLVTWPALLAAGERVGKVAHVGYQWIDPGNVSGGLMEKREAQITTSRMKPVYHATDPEAAP